MVALLGEASLHHFGHIVASLLIRSWSVCTLNFHLLHSLSQTVNNVGKVSHLVLIQVKILLNIVDCTFKILEVVVVAESDWRRRRLL